MTFQPNPAIYDSQNYLVLDFEVDVADGGHGSALDKNSQLVLACWSSQNGYVHSQFGNELEQNELLRAVHAADFIVAHNAKFELGWLARMGVDIDSLVVFDTMVAEYVLAGNLASVDDKTGLPPLALSLDACCRRRGLKQKDAIVDIWMKNGIPVSQMPTAWLGMRCSQDVESTNLLFISQRKALKRSGRLPVLYTRCLLTPVLTSLETQGVCLDSARVMSTYQEYTTELGKLSTKMSALTGGINWRSSKQAAEFIYDTLQFRELTDRQGKPKRTGTGARSCDQKTLALLRAETPEQREFIELRKHIGRVSAALSKNLEYFKHACETQNGIFHARFNQTVAATHRLSCSGIPSPAGSVQFQSLPRNFKTLFKARYADWLVMEVDGSQLEFRVAAFLGDDRQARADILNADWDAHIATASYMYGIPYEELYPRWRAGDKKADAMRTAAKPETFKPLYGGSKGSKQQERWYKGFRERYVDLARVQEGWVAQVREKKVLITPWGMRYYWPRATVSKSGYTNVTASVYNYPIQALATAEIIPIALVYLWKATAALRAAGKLRIVNTIHDSIVLELAPDTVNDVKQIALDSLGVSVYTYLSDIYKLDFDVELGASIKIGTHWGEGSEESYNLRKDGTCVRVR